MCEIPCMHLTFSIPQFRNYNRLKFLWYYPPCQFISHVGWVDGNAISEATCRGEINPWFRFIFVPSHSFPPMFQITDKFPGSGIYFLSAGD